jgi:H+/gluconate symporter-like permease
MIRFAAIVLLISAIPRPSAAQGLPVDTGSYVPVGLWLAGVVMLRLVMAYAIMRNRNRSRGEKQLTEEATRANYANENQKAKFSEID